MIVLVGDVLEAVDDPGDVFALMAGALVIGSGFSVVSWSHETVGEYLASLGIAKGDYLAGKVGPGALRKVVWRGQRLGPAWALNTERWWGRRAEKGVKSHHHSEVVDNRVFGYQTPAFVSVLGMCGVLEGSESHGVGNGRKLYRTWTTMTDIRQHFKFPRELAVVPFKRIKRTLKTALKHGRPLGRTFVPLSNPYWVFNHLFLGEHQREQLKTLIDALEVATIVFPFESVVDIIADFERTLLTLRASRFLKDSFPTSDFARYCLLVKNHVFATIPRSQRDLNVFWQEVCLLWEGLTPEERNRKMLNSLGAIRSWADDEEMRLFIGSSESDEEIVEWDAGCVEGDSVSGESDEEAEEDQVSEEGTAWNTWNSTDHLKRICEVEDEAACEGNSTIGARDETTLASQATDEELPCDAYDDMTSTPVTTPNAGTEACSTSGPEIIQCETVPHELPNNVEKDIIAITIDFNKPGALTALLDSPSSCGSSARDFSDDEFQLRPHTPRRGLSLPEKIDKFEKLSGNVGRHFTINRRTHSPVESSCGESFELEHEEMEEVRSTKKREVNKLKTTLKPVMQRATSSAVCELKQLVELRPPSPDPGVGNSSGREEGTRGRSTKRSISSIFAALLDDNMRDLATSAEYRHKIVRPQDLYNRIKISSDKPWEVLSRKTKERYYQAFLRRYEGIVECLEEARVDDIVEIVRVCGAFGDWRRPIVRYAVELVHADEVQDTLSTENTLVSESDECGKCAQEPIDQTHVVDFTDTALSPRGLTETAMNDISIPL